MSVKTHDPAKAFAGLADNYFVEYAPRDVDNMDIDDVRTVVAAAYINSRDEDEAAIDLPRREGRAAQLTSLLITRAHIDAGPDEKRALARITMSPHPLVEREALELCRKSTNADVQRTLTEWAVSAAVHLSLRRLRQNTTPLEKFGIGITPDYMLDLLPQDQQRTSDVLAARALAAFATFTG